MSKRFLVGVRRKQIRIKENTFGVEHVVPCTSRYEERAHKRGEEGWYHGIYSFLH